ncbi:MAG TPA: protein kinase [Gemmatimonadaceae bacterium]|nr:protein kinase [Gemmatimonadaceae bacterium]
MDQRLSEGLESRYTIEREIGRGGMATVYLARDVRHKRNVALKVLSPELGAVLGAERFLAEIQVTANLQHPNLLPLFDSGEVEGLLFYVMPYVEGETLRVRLEREKQLPVQEAVRIATCVAGALAYAHRNNVIHRDLKPENILMQEGQPLIADFGIALAVSNAGGARITQTGLSLGTPQYMSPEQATGDRVVDGRADIYSLGAITYEMLVGDPPHTASTSQAVIAKLLTEKPASVRRARPNVPPHVEAAVACALEKLAADRFATAREFADALDGRGPVATEATRESVAPGAARRRVPRAREIAAWSLAAILGGMLAWQLIGGSDTTEPPVVRTNFDLPPGMRVNDVITGPTLAVSPSGDMVAFTATGLGGFRMYLRHVDELNARELANVAGRNLAFSPDGRWLVFTEGNILKKISIDGGQPVTLGETGGSVPYGLAWDASNRIYIGSFSGLWSVPASGGEPSVVATIDSSGPRVGRRWPLVLPGGKALAYVSGNSTSGESHLEVLDLTKGSIASFDLVTAMPLRVLDEHLVYVSPTGGLLAVRFDTRANRPVGSPIHLDDGILLDPAAGAKASLSAAGTLAYLRGRSQFELVTAGAGKEPTPLIREPGRYSNPRVSPDGGRVAITVSSASTSDIWIYDRARNTFTRLTSDGLHQRAEWTSDGKRVVFIGNRAGKTGIWWQPADGSGPAELLYTPDVEPFEALISADMKWLVFRTSPGSRNPRDILAVPMTGPKTVTTLVTGPHAENMPRISPDGRWMAYQSNETGRFEIYVRPFPGAGARVQVSDNGGSEPLWGRSGGSLYFRDAIGNIAQVRVTTGTDFSIGARSVVLTGDYLTDATHPNYDVAPDGRFLVLRRAGAESQTVVVHNWRRELRENIRAARR